MHLDRVAFGDAIATCVLEAEKFASQESEARRLLAYVTDINLAQRYCQETNFAQAAYLLQSHQPQAGMADLRGFEWRYLYRICRGNYLTALPKHEQVLGGMEFSPDGRMLAT